MGLGPGVWQCKGSTLTVRDHTAASQRTRGIRRAVGMRACRRVGCSLCGLTETTPSSKEADSFRPLVGLDHPVSSIPAATTPREPPSCPGAQPSQPSCGGAPVAGSCSSFVMYECQSCRTVLVSTAALGDHHPNPIEPSRSSPASPRKETTRPCRNTKCFLFVCLNGCPVAQSLGLDHVGWTETRVTPCACPVLRRTVTLQLCTICICTDAAASIRRLGEVCVCVCV